MDFSHIPAADQPLYRAIVQGMQELAASLPPQLRPLAGPILQMATDRVASVSPPDLRGFLAQAHDFLGQFLAHEGETPFPIGEGQLTAALAPVEPQAALTDAEPAAAPGTPLPAADLTGRTWWDPIAQEYTGRVPTEADATAIIAAIEASPETDELNRLLAAGQIVFDTLAA